MGEKKTGLVRGEIVMQLQQSLSQFLRELQGNSPSESQVEAERYQSPASHKDKSMGVMPPGKGKDKAFYFGLRP